MKKLIAAALAASVVATPGLAQPFGHDFARQVRTVEVTRSYAGYDHRRGYDRDWRRGDRFDRRYARNYREVRNPRHYRLREAPRGYRWVQSGDDAVLVAITTGIVAALLANAF